MAFASAFITFAPAFAMALHRARSRVEWMPNRRAPVSGPKRRLKAKAIGSCRKSLREAGMNSIRKRLTYANVAATLALLFAMSGGHWPRITS
jgi:hypothetical protein